MNTFLSIASGHFPSLWLAMMREKVCCLAMGTFIDKDSRLRRLQHNFVQNIFD